MSLVYTGQKSIQHGSDKIKTKQKIKQNKAKNYNNNQTNK